MAVRLAARVMLARVVPGKTLWPLPSVAGPVSLSMEPRRLALLALLLAATLVITPLAAAEAASGLSDASTGADARCGPILEMGVIPWAICVVYDTGGAVNGVLCLAWRILWGPTNPCPFPIPL